MYEVLMFMIYLSNYLNFERIRHEQRIMAQLGIIIVIDSIMSLYYVREYKCIDIYKLIKISLLIITAVDTPMV